MQNHYLQMSKLRNVLRCYYQGNGIKRTSSLTDVSKNTVKKYITIYNQSNYSLKELLEMPDDTLCRIFQDKDSTKTPSSSRDQELQKLLPDYVKRLKKKTVTKLSLYEEYIDNHPNGYGRTTFYEKIILYKNVHHPIGHIEHKAGDKMYVDYAGDKLEIINPSTGEVVKVEVFVAILPCSQLTFVEAVGSQTKADFIKGVEDALLFFGGVPAAIVPDNLKSAVTTPKRYESEINEDFMLFADHYGASVVPARVRKPRDKALVENAVKLAYRSIYTVLEGRTFYDIESLNQAIRPALEKFNNKKMSDKPYSRRAQFEEIERDTLAPLNPIRFELKERKTVTVLGNSYFTLDKHHYSVDPKYIKKKINLIYNTSEIKAYYRYECIAEHKRSYIPYGYTDLKEHNLPGNRSASNFSIEPFITKASEIHPDVVRYMEITSERRKYPELSYKSCRGIISLVDKYGKERLINACKLGLEMNAFGFNCLEKILKTKQDITINVQEDDNLGKMPKHNNIRGKEYFNDKEA